MKKWVLKAIVQKSLSFMPFRYKLNRFFQKYVTKGLELNDEHFGYKIESAKDHVEFLLKYKKNTNQKCLELGTGWYPIVPIALFLNGVEVTHTIDIASHLSEKSIKDTIVKFNDWNKQKKLLGFIPNLNEERWKSFLALSKDIENTNLEYLLNFFNIVPIVGDARSLQYSDNTFDFICSNNTFEHVYKDVLIEILVEFGRVLKDDGIMSHFIDMSDHFAHFDKSITIYNFLKFSEPSWNLIDNSIQPQNRMRFIDYKKIYENINHIILEESVRKGNINEVKSINISNRFKNYLISDLAISHGYIISKV